MIFASELDVLRHPAESFIRTRFPTDRGVPSAFVSDRFNCWGTYSISLTSRPQPVGDSGENCGRSSGRGFSEAGTPRTSQPGEAVRPPFRTVGSISAPVLTRAARVSSLGPQTLKTFSDQSVHET